MPTKEYKMQEVQDVQLPPTIEIPGITVPKVNYGTSIGGKDAPAPGADKTSENIAAGITGQGSLATKSTISDTDIVNGTITGVKLALATIEASVIAAGAITENKLFAGAVTADKIAANTITAAKIAANTITASQIASKTITSSEINVSELSAIAANIGTITSGTVTGALIQTSSATSPVVGAKMSSSIGGIAVYGESFKLYDSANSPTLYGSIGGFGGYYNIATSSNRNMLLDAGSGTVHFSSHAASLTDGGKNLGYYNFRWGNCFTLNVTFQDGYYLNKSGNNLKLNGLNRIELDGGVFRRVGFTFKDGTSTNRYIEVLAVNDPV